MATARAPIAIRYNLVDTYPGTFQENYVGVSNVVGRRGWRAQMPSVDDGIVNCMVRLGRYLYIGGSFTLIGGTTRNHLAAFDVETGQLADWNPNADDSVLAMATDGASIYIGGSFTLIGSTTRNHLAKINPAGVLNANWNPDANSLVTALAYSASGALVYVVGVFTTVNGATTRNHAAALDATTGTATAFDPDFGTPAQVVAVDDDLEFVYFGGAFTTADGGTTRNHICRFTFAGALDAWDPDANAAVVCLFLKDSLIYVGGGFTTIGGQPRSNMACLDQSGAATSFNITANGIVYTINFADGFLVIGGDFTLVQATNRKYLAGVSEDSTVLDTWDPNMDNDVLVSLVFERTIYVSGIFTTFDGNPQARLAAIPHPYFTDANAIFISKATGDDANPGTLAAPKASFEAVLGNTSTLADRSGNGNTLVEVGVIGPQHQDCYVVPPSGNYCSAYFAATGQYHVPAAVGVAIGASNAFTVSAKVNKVQSNTSNELMWSYSDGSTDASHKGILIVADGTIRFRIGITFSDSAAGTFQFDGEFHDVIASYDGTTHTKKLWYDGRLVIDTTQTATVGTLAAHSIGGSSVVNTLAFEGWVDDFRIYDSAITSTTLPADIDLQCRYEFETETFFKLSGKSYVVVTDDENYSEYVRVIDDNCGIYALDGKAPTIQIVPGVTAGTYGARVVGRTKFSTGAGSTFFYVSKSGDDATGIRGNSALPFKTIQAALDDGTRVAGDTVQIQDSGLYIGDLNAGAKAVTIQAADGQVPTLRNADATSGGIHITITAGSSLALYGLFLQEKTGSLGKIAGPNSDLTVWDCSLVGGANGLYSTGSSTRTWQIRNCLFSGQAGNWIKAFVASLDVFNCQHIKTSSNGSDTYGLDYHESPAVTIRQSSFSGLMTTAAVGTANTNVAAVKCLAEIERNTFTDLGGSGAGAGHGIKIDNNIATKTLTLARHNTFLNTFGDAIQFNGGDYNCYLAKSNLATACGTTAAFTGDGTGGVGAYVIQGFADCASLNATLDSFHILNTAPNTTRIRNCTSLGATRYGIEITGAGGSNGTGVFVTGFAEDNSGSNAAHASTAIALDYSFLGTALGTNISLGTGSFSVSPEFISTTSGFELVGLGPTSPAILNGNAAADKNAGVNDATVLILASGITVDGFYLEGLDNLLDAQGMRPGFDASQISYNTNTGPVVTAAFNLNNGSLVEFCQASMSHGNGFLLMTPLSVAVRCVANEDAGAGFVVASPGVAVSNCSSYGCGFGQYDVYDFGGDFHDNIFSESSTFDYSGGGVQTYSDIERLDPARPNALDVNSTQLNPLYNNPAEGDLRIDALAAGNAFDSPALETGTLGGDMGAFGFFYGSLVQTYDTLTLDTPNRNPDSLVRTGEPIKLAEGVQEDGKTYSVASTYKRGYQFRWDDSSNDMPTAQVTALENMYTSPTGQVFIDFGDGLGFVEGFVLRETPFEFTEMTGLYSSEEVPTPVREISFRMV
jgi:hypothetical protein